MTTLNTDLPVTQQELLDAADRLLRGEHVPLGYLARLLTWAAKQAGADLWADNAIYEGPHANAYHDESEPLRQVHEVHDEPAPASAAVSGWQPIETAPKDGTWILAWDSEDSEPVIIQWLNSGCWRTHTYTYGTCNHEIFHWMPLPDPPAAVSASLPVPVPEPSAQDYELTPEDVIKQIVLRHGEDVIITDGSATHGDFVMWMNRLVESRLAAHAAGLLYSLHNTLPMAASRPTGGATTP